jgi:hypothetical protein
MSDNKKHLQAPTRETFLSLLYGAFNIAPTVELDSPEAELAVSGALQATTMIFDMLEENPNEHFCDGVLLVVRLLTETTCAEDPEVYATLEARRGLDGARFENEGARIKLPQSVK